VTDLRASEIAVNRALWAVLNERFTDAAAEDMWARPDPVWGLFAVPERDLGVLGDIRDLDLLELACGRFDLVVSEHGAAAWCDPERWLPEAARLLRPGGRLVFLTNSHLSALCVPAQEGVAGERLVRGQREAYRVRWPGGGIEFHPSHGDWVRLLRRSGFVVEAMHEIYAPAAGADHPFYEIVSAEWATRWPADELWVATRS